VIILVCEENCKKLNKKGLLTNKNINNMRRNNYNITRNNDNIRKIRKKKNAVEAKLLGGLN